MNQPKSKLSRRTLFAGAATVGAAAASCGTAEVARPPLP
jgi:nitrous oxide reductase